MNEISYHHVEAPLATICNLLYMIQTTASWHYIARKCASICARNICNVIVCKLMEILIFLLPKSTFSYTGYNTIHFFGKLLISEVRLFEHLCNISDDSGCAETGWSWLDTLYIYILSNIECINNLCHKNTFTGSYSISLALS